MVGTAVKEGDILGLLKIGHLLVPVAAPAQGIVMRVVAADGGVQLRFSANGAANRIVGGRATSSTHGKSRATMMEIDLNADMGEGFGPYRIGEDESLMEVVSQPTWPAAITPAIRSSWTRPCGLHSRTVSTWVRTSDSRT